MWSAHLELHPLGLPSCHQAVASGYGNPLWQAVALPGTLGFEGCESKACQARVQAAGTCICSYLQRCPPLHLTGHPWTFLPPFRSDLLA